MRNPLLDEDDVLEVDDDELPAAPEPDELCPTTPVSVETVPATGARSTDSSSVVRAWSTWTCADVTCALADATDPALAPWELTAADAFCDRSEACAEVTCPCAVSMLCWSRSNVESRVCWAFVSAVRALAFAVASLAESYVACAEATYAAMIMDKAAEK